MPGLLDAPPTVLPPGRLDAGGPLTHNSPLVRAWAARLGDIPVDRIVLDPAAGHGDGGGLGPRAAEREACAN